MTETTELLQQLSIDLQHYRIEKVIEDIRTLSIDDSNSLAECLEECADSEFKDQLGQLKSSIALKQYVCLHLLTMQRLNFFISLAERFNEQALLNVLGLDLTRLLALFPLTEQFLWLKQRLGTYAKFPGYVDLLNENPTALIIVKIKINHYINQLKSTSDYDINAVDDANYSKDLLFGNVAFDTERLDMIYSLLFKIISPQNRNILSEMLTLLAELKWKTLNINQPKIERSHHRTVDDCYDDYDVCFEEEQNPPIVISRQPHHSQRIETSQPPNNASLTPLIQSKSPIHQYTITHSWKKNNFTEAPNGNTTPQLV